jgi:hypothetical protein
MKQIDVERTMAANDPIVKGARGLAMREKSTERLFDRTELFAKYHQDFKKIRVHLEARQKLSHYLFRYAKLAPTIVLPQKTCTMGQFTEYKQSIVTGNSYNTHDGNCSLKHLLSCAADVTVPCSTSRTASAGSQLQRSVSQ